MKKGTYKTNNRLGCYVTRSFVSGTMARKDRHDLYVFTQPSQREDMMKTTGKQEILLIRTLLGQGVRYEIQD